MERCHFWERKEQEKKKEEEENQFKLQIKFFFLKRESFNFTSKEEKVD